MHVMRIVRRKAIFSYFFKSAEVSNTQMFVSVTHTKHMKKQAQQKRGKIKTRIEKKK